MATLKATLTSVEHKGTVLEIGIDYKALSDNSFIDSRVFTYYDPAVVGSQILADVRTVGSTYINMLDKQATLQSIIGTTINI